MVIDMMFQVTSLVTQTKQHIYGCLFFSECYIYTINKGVFMMRITDILFESNKDGISKDDAQALLQALKNDADFYFGDDSDQDIIKSMILWFEEIDPTPTHKFVPWIIREYIKKRIDSDEISHILPVYLREFLKMTSELSSMGKSTDLLNYTKDELFQLIKSRESSHDEDLIYTIYGMLRADRRTAGEILYIGPEGLLTRPKNIAHYRIMSYKTKWSDHNVYFNESSNPYYIWRGKGGAAKFIFALNSIVDKYNSPLTKSSLNFFS